MWVGVVDPAITRELRRAVLRPNLAPGEPLPGDGLATGAHLAALEQSVVVGTCFVFPDPCRWLPEHPAAASAWRLRQMATAPDRREHGIGAAVLATALDHVRACGGALLWCHAREAAIGFYAAHGFRRHGAIFIDPEHPIPHLRMYRELSDATTSS